MGFPRQECWSGLPFPSSGDLPDPGTKAASPALAGGLFTAEPAEKSYIYIVMSNSLQPLGPYSPWKSLGQNTGVGSYSLLQGIFLIQWWNPDLLHCRWILSHLSYQESPGPSGRAFLQSPFPEIGFLRGSGSEKPDCQFERYRRCGFDL